MIPSWILWLFALSGIVISAFKAWQDQRRIVEAKELELQNATTTNAKDKEKLVFEHIEQRQALEVQVKNLKTQLDDRTKRLENEEKLGNLHQHLLNRASQIRKMGASEYCQKHAESYQKEILDPDTKLLLDAVETFLEKEIKGASLAIFRNPENFKETPVERLNSATSGPMAEVAFKFYTKELYKQRVIDRLNHWASNLMKIIENKGENK